MLSRIPGMCEHTHKYKCIALFSLDHNGFFCRRSSLQDLHNFVTLKGFATSEHLFIRNVDNLFYSFTLFIVDLLEPR